MPTQRHSEPTRLPNNGSNTGQADANFTAMRYGNDHGSIAFGHIHEDGSVTSSVLLKGHDGRHSFCMDKTGRRKGWTQSVSPGNFTVSCGDDNEEAQDTLMLHARNGNICIIAENGKIRLQGKDIELNATGEDSSKGNIRLNASENITLDANKVLVNAKNKLMLVTSGDAELAANAQLQLYGAIIRGVTDACSVKDSKNNLQRIQKKNNNG
tara:strand:- start:2169 stop:2801 length:633 start_codon:yes stop_codon:yes gene_type:complete